MKKTIKTLLPIIVFLFLIYGCGKNKSAKIVVTNNSESGTITQSVTIRQDNGFLIFNSVNDFELAVNYFSGKSKNEIKNFVLGLGLNSYQIEPNSNDSDLVENYEIMPYFFYLINSNGIIKIGNRIYRMDFENKKVAILPTGDFKEVVFLQSNNEVTGKTLIENFNSDIIFDINFSNKDSLRNQNDTLKLSNIWRRCKEKAGSTTYTHDFTQGYKYEGRAYRFKVRAEYLNYGIYKELGVTVIHQYYKGTPIAGWYTSSAHAPQLIYLSDYSWKKKCKNQYGSGTANLFYYSNSSSHFHPYYNRIKSLSQYYIRTISGGKGLDGNYYFLSTPLSISWP